MYFAIFFVYYFLPTLFGFQLPHFFCQYVLMGLHCHPKITANGLQIAEGGVLLALACPTARK
jgi:hypothetical protein